MAANAAIEAPGERVAPTIGSPVTGKYGFGFETEANEVARTLKDHIVGKTVLITGVSPDGLGAEAAVAIALAQPALLVLAARDASKIAQTAARIAQEHPGVATMPLVLDLNSLASVRTAAATVLALEQPLDVLINNAGIMAAPYSQTADGFESQLGVNHLAHFVLTNLLVPKLLAAVQKSGEARVINVTSAGHRFSDIRWDDAGFQDGKAYDRWAAYGQSKTANILFSLGLAQKLGKKGIVSFSLHPGGIMTPLAKYIDPGELSQRAKGYEFKTLQQGSATHLVAAFDPSIIDSNGGYLEDCGISQPKEYARDPKSAERLWALSEELIGQTFAY